MQESNRQAGFWNGVTQLLGQAECRSVIVTHLVSDRPTFLDALNNIAPIAAIIPKPNSINAGAMEVIAERYQLWHTSRDQLSHGAYVVEQLQEFVGGDKFVILDIGGYFSDVLPAIVDKLPNQLVGIVEDTENGHRRYERLDRLAVPVISAARSPLKQPEDYLVGEAIVFSADAVLREMSEITVGKVALVIGFGKIGQSIARRLAGRGIQVMVFDNDPAKRVFAFSQGYTIPERRPALAYADLIFCATGNKALTYHDFDALKDGAYIFSVTSSDDEFLFEANGDDSFEMEPTGSEHVQRIPVRGSHLYLVNRGNAINFLHSGVVGSFINLIQSELLAGIHFAQELVKLDAEEVQRLGAPSWERRHIQAVEPRRRRLLAALWIEHFGTRLEAPRGRHE